MGLFHSKWNIPLSNEIEMLIFVNLFFLDA